MAKHIIKGKEVTVSQEVKDYIEMLEIQVKCLESGLTETIDKHFERIDKVQSLMNETVADLEELKPQLVTTAEINSKVVKFTK